MSKPLRVQMKRLVDRTRWPVLVTYSDEGQGHTGYVYALTQCVIASMHNRPSNARRWTASDPQW